MAKRQPRLKPPPANSFEVWWEAHSYSPELKTMCEAAFVGGLGVAERIAVASAVQGQDAHGLITREIQRISPTEERDGQ